MVAFTDHRVKITMYSGSIYCSLLDTHVAISRSVMNCLQPEESLRTFLGYFSLTLGNYNRKETDVKTMLSLSIYISVPGANLP